MVFGVVSVEQFAVAPQANPSDLEISMPIKKSCWGILRPPEVMFFAELPTALFLNF